VPSHDDEYMPEGDRLLSDLQPASMSRGEFFCVDVCVHVETLFNKSSTH